MTWLVHRVATVLRSGPRAISALSGAAVVVLAAPIARPSFPRPHRPRAVLPRPAPWAGIPARGTPPAGSRNAGHPARPEGQRRAWRAGGSPGHRHRAAGRRDRPVLS